MSDNPPTTTDDTGLDEAVEAAAARINDIHYTVARKRNNGQFVNEKDEFQLMARAALNASGLPAGLREAQRRNVELTTLARRFVEAADTRVQNWATLLAHDPYFDSYHDARMPLALLLDELATTTEPTKEDDA